MDDFTKDMFLEIKATARRNFVLVVLLTLVLFLSNAAWLYVWSLPENVRSESYELQGQDDANVVYNSQGQVHIDGKSVEEEEVQ